MDELKSIPSPLPPDEDLTEVRKPTSLLIAQFFLFPLIIIGICVGIFLFFGYLLFGNADQPNACGMLGGTPSGSEPNAVFDRWSISGAWLCGVKTGPRVESSVTCQPLSGPSVWQRT